MAKSWTFTINNYLDEDIKLLTNIECNYCIWGKEIGTENKTPHLQGFITFKTSKRLTGLKKLHNKAHWEQAKDNEAAINYCMKDNDFTIRDLRKQGNRTDLNEIGKLIKETGLKNTAKNNLGTYMKYHNGMEKIQQLFQEERNFKPLVVWIYGPTGTNKTRQVVEAEKDLWISGRDLKWWNGYENQESVLLDDFRDYFCKFQELLRILDRYPYTVEIKGGSRQLNSKRIYITSCYHPNDVYDVEEDTSQLLRRIDDVICTKPKSINPIEEGLEPLL